MAALCDVASDRTGDIFLGEAVAAGTRPGGWTHTVEHKPQAGKGQAGGTLLGWMVQTKIPGGRGSSVSVNI